MINTVYSNFYAYDEEEKSKPLLGDAATSSLDLTMDLTSQVKGGFEATDGLQEGFGPLSLKIYGLTYCLNLIYGPLTISKGIQELKISQKVEDFTGSLLGGLKCFQGSLQTVAGGLFVPASGLAIAFYFTLSKTTYLFSTIFGSIAGICLAGSSLVLMIMSTIELIESVRVRSKIRKILNEEGIPSDKAYKKALKVLQANTKTVEGRLILNRVFGKESIEILSTATPSKAREVVETLLSKSNKAIAFKVLLVALAISAVVLTVLSFILTQGLAPIIFAAVGALINLIWMAVDFGKMIDGFQSNEKGLIDKPWIIFSFLFSIAAMSLALLFCLSNWAMGIILGVGLAVLLIHILCFGRVTLGEEKKA